MAKCGWCEDETAGSGGFCDDVCRALADRMNGRPVSQAPVGYDAKKAAGRRELMDRYHKDVRRERSSGE